MKENEKLPVLKGEVVVDDLGKYMNSLFDNF